MRAFVIAALLLAVLVGAGLFAFRIGAFNRPAEEPAAEVVSPEAASEAEDKIARLGADGEEVRLNAVELTSLFRYRPEFWSLGSLAAPTVEMEGQTLELRGSVPTDEIPPQPELEAIRYLLPDTTEIVVSGTLEPSAPGVAVLQVASIEVAGMPIPARFFPLILERVGPSGQQQPNSITLPLPDAMSAARVENGELVLSP